MSKLVRFTAMAVIFLFSAATFAEGDAGPKVGQTAPEFSMTDLKGKSHSLAQLRKKGHVMLVFWSTRCHFCHALIPNFKATDKKYSGKNFTFAAVNIGVENQPEVEAYVFENELNYLVLNEDDKKADVAEAYQLIGTPTIQLIAPDGKVLYRGHFLPKDLDALMKPSTS